MCGYILGNRDTLRSNGVKNLLDKQKHRGVDGYGAIALYNNGESMHIKYMTVAPLVNWIDDLKGNPYIFVHHRATSVGGTKLKLAHPLEFNDSILMQNGTNRDPYQMVTMAESDSEALVMLLDSMTPVNLDKYILDNVGVLVFRKDNEFYLYKDASRPLNVHTSGLICSEPLVAGKWSAVNDGMYPIHVEDSKLVGLDLFVDTEISDIGSVGVCSFCKKRHYIPEGYTVCNSCVAEGVPQKEDYFQGRSTTPNNYMGYDEYDYYGYGWEWVNGEYVDPSATNVVDVNQVELVEIWEIIATKPLMDSVPDVVKRGIPIKLGNKYYLVPGTPQDACGLFMVKVVKFSPTLTLAYRRGFLPLSEETADPMSLDSLAVYWNTDELAYDLLRDVYYLDDTLLSDADKDILIYDDYMKGYAIPYEYEFDAETYLNWC